MRDPSRTSGLCKQPKPCTSQFRWKNVERPPYVIALVFCPEIDEKRLFYSPGRVTNSTCSMTFTIVSCRKSGIVDQVMGKFHVSYNWDTPIYDIDFFLCKCIITIYYTHCLVKRILSKQEPIYSYTSSLCTFAHSLR